MVYNFIEMGNKQYIQIIILFSLLYITKSLDNCTLSNYKNIELKNITGLFEPNFKESIIYGNLNYTFYSKVNDSNIILDTKNLEILNITDENGKEMNYTHKQNKEDEILGRPLIITLEFDEGKIILINIKFKTIKEGKSAQFLTKEQTYGGQYPYLFTMSPLILGRELFPGQDTPAIKFKFYLGIKVPENFLGLISGVFKNEVKNNDQTKTYYYEQNIPIPHYLVSLAAGNITERVINKNFSIFSEPEFINDVYDELGDFLPEILNKSKSYMGEYVWEKYNVLVLPKSFPYSGIENPCLIFCSPCLINGDKSLVDIVAHELIHSWSGNLVTNDNWRDFWLNEGITMFLQRKIMSMWKDEDYAKMDAILGLFYIDESLDYFGEDSNYTCLRPDLTGISPDDILSDIPYEKGFNLMYYIESLIGNEIMKDFFQSYFQNFKFKSIDAYAFKNYLIDFCHNNSISQETLDKINWNKWFYNAGKCPEKNNFTNKYEFELNKTLDSFLKGDLNGLNKTIRNWTHTTKVVFLNTLKQRYEFLTKEQHNFITNTLQLYNETFLVKTYYYKLILAKTEEFYDVEKDNLKKYLSNYGAVDYMSGIYGLLYKRNEEFAEQTLQNLSSFYHSVMLKQAESEIEEAKQNFPILTLELKNDNQCSFLSFDTKIEIQSKEEFKDSFGNITIEKGVSLKSKDDDIVELQCYLNVNEKYCKIKNKIEKSGNYSLYVSNRIQNQTYVIKNSEGKSLFQTYEKEIIIDEDKGKTQKNYTINYYDDEKFKIYFKNEPDKNIKIKYNETDVECIFKENNKKVLECKIDETIFSYDTDNPDEYKEYELKIFDLCHTEKYSFYLKVNNKPDIAIIAIIIIIIIGLIVVVVVSFYIYRSVNKKKNIDIEEVDKNKLLSEM